MSYRNPLEAAMARAAALEQELAEQKNASSAELARMEREHQRALDEVARLREQLARTPAAKEPDSNNRPAGRLRNLININFAQKDQKASLLKSGYLILLISILVGFLIYNIIKLAMMVPGPICPEVLPCYRAEKQVGTAAGSLVITLDARRKVVSLQVEGEMSQAIKSCVEQQTRSHFPGEDEDHEPGVLSCTWSGNYAGATSTVMLDSAFSPGAGTR